MTAESTPSQLVHPPRHSSNHPEGIQPPFDVSLFLSFSLVLRGTSGTHPSVSWKPMDCKIKLTWLFRGSRTEYHRNLIPSGLFYFRVPLFFFFFHQPALRKKLFANTMAKSSGGTVKNGSALPLAAKFWQIGAAEGRIFKPCEEREGRYEGTVPLLS